MSLVSDAPAPEVREGVGGRVLAFRAAVGGTVASYLTIEVWDVFRYDWLRGYDAWASSLYVQSIEQRHALPTPATSDVWHNPPLFYAAAALIQSHSAWLGIEAHKAVQLLSVLSGLVVVVLSLLVARELFPERRWVQLGTLVAVATTPVLLRGSIMYHPELLATALATGGLFLAVRAAHRGWTWPLGAAAGLLLGLADLTRAWALAEAVAVAGVAALSWLHARRPGAGRFLACFVAVFVVLSAPWYARQEIHYGNPLAFSKPDPSQWLPSGRPASFFTTLAVTDVFSDPYQPTYSNALLPVVYTDWWGDYSRYFHMPASLTDSPSKLPGRYRSTMVVQSVVGVLPTLMGVLGVIALAVVAVRRREPALQIAIAAGALVLVSFVAFLVHYPKRDGDNIKALYIVDLAPVAALSVAWSLDWLRRHSSRPVLWAVLGWFAITGAYDVSFLVLR